MKKNITLILILAVLVIVFMIARTIKDTTENLGNTLKDLTKDAYRLENLQVSELEELQQIGTCNYQEDVRFEKVKEGIFTDDEIIASYSCNVNIGIDFADTKEGWAQKKGDSVFLKLPSVKVLNTNNKVITRSSFPIRTGTWSNAELQQLSDSANTYFINKAKDHFPMAQKELEDKLRGILSLKYKYVKIEFEK